MAQLPPKIPTMVQHQKMSPPMADFIPTNTAATFIQPQQPSWVDEFLDFSAERRGAHRRWVSDSIAFLDPSSCAFLEECGQNMSSCGDQNNGVDDRLDDVQLMCMFHDELNGTVPSNPSTPSDQNSNSNQITDRQRQHQQPKNIEPGEVDSSCKREPLEPTAPSCNTGNDHISDPKRVKRILANRQSAQRSRVRKLQYISQLERNVTTLQTEVSALSPRVAFLDHKRLILNADNSALKQRIAALAQDKIFKDAHQEALKNEIERLRQLYHHQSLTNIVNPTPGHASCSTPPSVSSQQLFLFDPIVSTDKDV